MSIEILEDLTALVQKTCENVDLDPNSARAICSKLQGELDKYDVDVHYMNEWGFLNAAKLQDAMKRSSSAAATAELCDLTEIPADFKPVKKFKICLGTRHDTAPNNVSRMCNGVIYDVSEVDGKISIDLVFSSVGVIFDARKVTNPDEYDIYEVDFGSTIHYYYDSSYVAAVQKVTIDDKDAVRTTKFSVGKWLITSRNSAELNDLTFRGMKYSKVIADITAKYGFKPDQDIVYTIGYSHPKHHAAAELTAWVIQTYDRSTGEIRKYPRDLAIPTQRRVTSDAFRANKSKYGYILRSNVANRHDLIVKTRTFNRTNRYIMNFDHRNQMERAKMYEGFDFTVMKLYLRRNETNEFLDLFPVFRPQVQIIENAVRAASTHLCTAARGGKVKIVDNDLVLRIFNKFRPMIKPDNSPKLTTWKLEEAYLYIRQIKNISALMTIFGW
jgi:hypothetical protein